MKRRLASQMSLSDQQRFQAFIQGFKSATQPIVDVRQHAVNGEALALAREIAETEAEIISSFYNCMEVI